MFSDNQKISARQLQALLLMDWIGKSGLLLPGFFRGSSAGVMLTGILAGTVLAWLFLRLMIRSMGDGDIGFFDAVKQRLGNWAVAAFYLFYGVYFVYHAAMMLYLCGQVGGTYLLPEGNMPVLVAAPALIGWYLAGRGMEVRGRVCELLAFLLWAVFFLLLVLTVPEIRADRLWRGEAFEVAEAAKIGYYVLAGFGEIGVLPIAFPMMLGGENEKEKKTALIKAAEKALILSGLLLFLTFLECFGMFGQAGTERLEWPVITLMSSVHLPGVFLQRWDVLLIGLLLFSMFLSAGSGIYYLGFLSREMGMKKQPALIGVTLIAYLLAVGAGFIEEQNVFFQYGMVSYLVCIPGILLLTALMWARGTRTEGRRAVRGIRKVK